LAAAFAAPFSPMRRGQRAADSNHLDPQRRHRRQTLSALATGKIVAIVALTVLSGQAWSEGSIAIFSTGNKSCGEYLRAAETERKARPAHPERNSIYSMDYLDFASYTEGFLAGTNMNPMSTAGASTDLWGRMAWLEDYCRRNPLEIYINALSLLRKYLIDHGQ
jgi:hypothetical protein